MLKIIPVLLGYFGALSLVRSLTRPLPWASARIYGFWFFDLGFWLSALWLIICLGVFAFSILYTKPAIKSQWLYRKVDYSLLVFICGAAFYLLYFMLREGILFNIPIQLAVILYPAAAYLFAIIAFGEFFARLRDKTLLPTLYWLAFFKAYPVWRPIGFLTLLFLASQIYLMLYYFFTPVRLFSLFSICSLTYFAAFILNLSKEYDKANAEKIQAERFKSELITNVSHDIKTPLTSIINYVDLLKNEGLQGKSADYVQVLDKKSMRLKILIDDLMEASKAGTGNVRIDIKEINLGEIVGQAAGEFEDIFSAKGLTLVPRQPDEPVFVHADSRHLYRALENLFSNMAKYALDGTRVFVEIAARDNKTHLTFQNTSASPIGISDGEATEQFMRGDRSRQTEGSGLGLYIAKNLIELMGGELRVSIIGDLFRVDIIF